MVRVRRIKRKTQKAFISNIIAKQNRPCKGIENTMKKIKMEHAGDPNKIKFATVITKSLSTPYLRVLFCK